MTGKGGHRSCCYSGGKASMDWVADPLDLLPGIRSKLLGLLKVRLTATTAAQAVGGNGYHRRKAHLKAARNAKQQSLCCLAQRWSARPQLQRKSTLKRPVLGIFAS